MLGTGSWDGRSTPAPGSEVRVTSSEPEHLTGNFPDPLRALGRCWHGGAMDGQPFHPPVLPGTAEILGFLGEKGRCRETCEKWQGQNSKPFRSTPSSLDRRRRKCQDRQREGFSQKNVPSESHSAFPPEQLRVKIEWVGISRPFFSSFLIYSLLVDGLHWGGTTSCLWQQPRSMTSTTAQKEGLPPPWQVESGRRTSLAFLGISV